MAFVRRNRMSGLQLCNAANAIWENKGLAACDGHGSPGPVRRKPGRIVNKARIVQDGVKHSGYITAR